MKNPIDELTEVLAEEGVEDADKLETVRTIIHNRSRRCTPEENAKIMRDLCRSAGIDPDAPPSKPVEAAAMPSSVDYARIEKIVDRAVGAHRQLLYGDTAVPSVPPSVDYDHIEGIVAKVAFEGAPAAVRSSTEERLLSTEKALEILDISPRHIWRLAAAGELPGPVRLGRAYRWVYSEVMEYIQQRKDERRP